jgi:hypothetical protein
MTITQDGSRFSTTDEALAPEKPRLHLGALAALLAALLSIFSLVAGAWLLAAIAAIVLSLVALWSISQSQGLLYGRALAATALCLGLFMTALVVSQRIYRERLLVDRSEEVAREWIALVQAGKLDEAHHLTLPKAQRETETSLADYYADPDHAATFKYFRDKVEIKTLSQASDAQVALASSRRSGVAARSEQFKHQFEVTFPMESGKRLKLQVVTERSREPPRMQWSWRIADSEGTLQRTP